MPYFKIRYIQHFSDRNGKTRYYFRKAGSNRLSLPGTPGSSEFMAAYTAALSGAQTAKPIGCERVIPGTLNELIMKYYTWSEFTQLKANTQSNYKNILERFRGDYGHNEIKSLRRSDVQGFIDERAHTPSAAKNFLNRLRRLLDCAIDRNLLDENVARKVRPPKIPKKGFRAWTDEEIEKFKKKFPLGTRQHLTLMLLLYTGQRRSDIVKMTRSHLTGERIFVSQEKGRADQAKVELDIPVHRNLRAALDLLPKGQEHFLLTDYGKPVTHAGFGNWFAAAVKSAGLPKGCSAHGLRKAAARRLAEAGCTALEIASITGHRTLAEVAHYTASANQSHLAKAAMAKLD